MTKNNRFMPAFEKGHFNGLVDEGEYLRQSLLYKQILPRTPSRPKTSAISDNPVILSISSSCPSCSSWLKNPLNLRNLRLINDLRAYKALYICRDIFTDVVSALQIHLFLQNKAKFRKVKLSVTIEMKKDYDQMDTWSIRKNEPKTNPNEPKTNPILANKTTIRTQFKPNSNPIQSQTKPITEAKICNSFWILYQAISLNFSFAAPHTGHLSGAWPLTVLPHT